MSDQKVTNKADKKSASVEFRFRVPIRDITDKARETKENNENAKNLPFSKDLQSDVLNLVNSEKFANAKKQSATEIDAPTIKDSEFRAICTKELTKLVDKNTKIVFYATKPQYTIENSGGIRKFRQYIIFADENEIKLSDDVYTGLRKVFKAYNQRHQK